MAPLAIMRVRTLGAAAAFAATSMVQMRARPSVLRFAWRRRRATGVRVEPARRGGASIGCKALSHRGPGDAAPAVIQRLLAVAASPIGDTVKTDTAAGVGGLAGDRRGMAWRSDGAVADPPRHRFGGWRCRRSVFAHRRAWPLTPVHAASIAPGVRYRRVGRRLAARAARRSRDAGAWRLIRRPRWTALLHAVALKAHSRRRVGVLQSAHGVAFRRSTSVERSNPSCNPRHPAPAVPTTISLASACGP